MPTEQELAEAPEVVKKAVAIYNQAVADQVGYCTERGFLCLRWRSDG